MKRITYTYLNKDLELYFSSSGIADHIVFFGVLYDNEDAQSAHVKCIHQIDTYLGLILGNICNETIQRNRYWKREMVQIHKILKKEILKHIEGIQESPQVLLQRILSGEVVSIEEKKDNRDNSAHNHIAYLNYAEANSQVIPCSFVNNLISMGIIETDSVGSTAYSSIKHYQLRPVQVKKICQK